MSGQTKIAFEVKWRIVNIDRWLRSGDDSLYSPQFLAESLMNTCWKLKLSPNWHLAEKYVSLSLQRDVVDDGQEQMVLNYELSFLTSDGSPLKSKSYFKKFTFKTVSHELNVKEVEILKKVNLPAEVLAVSCKLWKSGSTVSKGGKCSIQSVISTKCIEFDGFVKDLRSGPSVVHFVFPSSEISLISFSVELEPGFIKFQRIAVKCNCFSLCYGELYFMIGRERNLISGIDLSTLLTSHKAYVLKCGYTRDKLIFNTNNDNHGLYLKLVITFYSSVKSENVQYELDNSLTCDSTERVDFSLSDISQLSEPVDESYGIEGNASTDGNECSTDIERKPLPFTTFEKDLLSLYNDRLFCDTKLQTDTETFPAHRSVLSARSPVFKKMFTTDMKERAGERINITDISSDTVRRMLQFLYTDCIEDLEMQSAKDLYIASDKYDIASLKQRCSSFIKKNLCPTNVCEVLVLADMHQDRDLESAAQDYVLTYDDDVFGSTEWKLFIQNCSVLAAKVMYLKCVKK